MLRIDVPIAKKYLLRWNHNFEWIHYFEKFNIVVRFSEFFEISKKLCEGNIFYIEKKLWIFDSHNFQKMHFLAEKKMVSGVGNELDL